MMQWITCAVNGSVLSRNEAWFLPVTPAEIAADAVAAARSGAAVVHAHVRDKVTGRASHDPALCRELVDRVREQEPDLVIHLTGGGGGTLPVGLHDPVIRAEDAAAIQSAEARLAHLQIAGADLTGLDCGSFSYGRGGDVYLSPTDMLFRAAAILERIGVRPELTVFDLGQMALAREMWDLQVVPANTPFCLGFGVIWGAPPRLKALEAMLDLLPPGADWGACSKGEAGQRFLAPLIVERGGGIRTGIEDHHTWDGAAVSNRALVEKAVETMARAGVSPLTGAALRAHLGLERKG